MPEKYCHSFGLAEVQLEAEPPLPTAAGELKPAAAVAERIG